MSYKRYDSAYGQCSKPSNQASGYSGRPSGSSRSSSGFTANSEDFVSKKKQHCDVLLNQRPILGGIADHWEVDFNCKDRDNDSKFKARCDGTDDNGKLVGQCRTRKDERVPGSRRSKLGTIEISPQGIMQAGQQNAYNGTDYRLNRLNCQNWADEMVDRVGLHNPIPKQGIDGPLGTAIDYVYSGAKGFSRFSSKRN